MWKGLLVIHVHRYWVSEERVVSLEAQMLLFPPFSPFFFRFSVLLLPAHQAIPFTHTLFADQTMRRGQEASLVAAAWQLVKRAPTEMSHENTHNMLAGCSQSYTQSLILVALFRNNELPSLTALLFSSSLFPGGKHDSRQVNVSCKEIDKYT